MPRAKHKASQTAAAKSLQSMTRHCLQARAPGGNKDLRVQQAGGKSLAFRGTGQVMEPSESSVSSSINLGQGELPNRIILSINMVSREQQFELEAGLVGCGLLVTIISQLNYSVPSVTATNEAA